MKLSNREIARKTDIAVSDLVSNGGYLNPMQANTFIRMLMDQPTLMNQVRVVPMNAPTMEINKIGFASRILHGAPASGTTVASTYRSSPTTEKVTLTTKEVIAIIYLPYDVLEDNIERGSLESTVMALMAERASLDLEDLIINGDTSISALVNDFLCIADGVLVQATSHVVDYTDSADQTIDRIVFKSGLKAMPNKYMRNRNAMRFFVSPDVETEWADQLAQRATPLGDSRIQDWQANRAYGVPVVGAALMPDDSYIFTYPKNLILGIQRQIQVETDRDIETRVYKIVLTMRLDLVFEEEDAVVKCIGLSPNEDSPTTSTT